MMRNSTYIGTGRAKATSRSEAGFTLIEMMIVVTMIAILAAVAFVAYGRHLRSSRIVAGREMISRIQAREETYFQQFGQYLNVSTAATFYPALVAADEPSSKLWSAIPVEWKNLGARPEGDSSYFAFLVIASVGPTHTLDADAPTLGVPPQPPVGGPLAPHAWYYVVGHADLDGKNATYGNGGCSGGLLTDSECTILAASSARSAIVGWNEGK